MTKMPTTTAVKMIDSQRWTCRIHRLQFNGTSIEDECGRASVNPRQNLLQLGNELRPPGLGAPECLLLIRPDARLLHAQMRPRARWRQREGHHALQLVGRVVGRDRTDESRAGHAVVST